jgi:hypothetical protein
MIFVTEPFSPYKLVKTSDRDSSLSVMKINKLKHFYTGIYPYRIMQSSFYPLDKKLGSIKVSNSIQEWCGQIYFELRQEEEKIADLHSYFENESFESMRIKSPLLEDDLLHMARIQPDSLPLGTFEIMPSIEYILLKHESFDPEMAEGRFIEKRDTLCYQLSYASTDRTVEINLTQEHPFQLLMLAEYEGDQLYSKASLRKSRRLPYWKLNAVADSTYHQLLSID